VAKSEVACEVKEAFLGFDNVSNDRRAAAVFFSLSFLFPFIHVCLFYMANSQFTWRNSQFTWRTASTQFVKKIG